MANNIFKGLLHPVSNPQRNAFDLSQRNVFSLKAGALIPAFCEDTVPGDYFEVSVSDLIRTMPLNTAAFLRAKMNYEFYFVPYNQLWHNFTQFAMTRKDKISSALKGIDFQPNVTIAHLESVYSLMSQLQFDSKLDAQRLCEHLGYGDISRTPVGDNENLSVSPFRLAAYQKIWNDYYRNPWRDEPTDSFTCVYNFDDLPCIDNAQSLLDNYNYTLGSSSRVKELLTLRYRGWKKDLFMGSLPNSQFGSISTVSVSPGAISVSGSTGTDYDRWRSGNSATPSASVAHSTNVVTDFEKNSLNTSGSAATRIAHTHAVDLVASQQAGSFDVLSLKRAEMLQLWKERTLRAGYRTKNLMQSHFGEDDSFDAEHHPRFLGSFSTQIGVDEVISQSATTYDSGMQSGNGALGEIAGKGIGVGNSGKISFKSDTYGILMCLASVVPNAEYDATMLDKLNVRHVFDDYYIPEFANLGLDSIPVWALNANYANATHFHDVIGYAPRYWEYKARVDKVYGAFKNGGGFQPWVSQRRNLQNFVNDGAIRIQDFYINPAVLDTIFASTIGYGVNPDYPGYQDYSSYDNDQFLCNVFFDVKAVRPMSVLGLPQW